MSRSSRGLHDASQDVRAQDPLLAYRPVLNVKEAAVSLADSRLFAKGKFFHYEGLLGTFKESWLCAFDGGDFAIVRFAPVDIK